jgi:hypothetical protein
MDQFEDFCLVTESVRHGMPVSVKVVDAAGRTVHESGDAQPKLATGGGPSIRARASPEIIYCLSTPFERPMGCPRRGEDDRQ